MTTDFDPALRKVEVTSFGFLHGFPDTAGNVLLVDLSRKLRNPFDDPAMRHRTGLEPEVSHYVLSTRGAVTVLEETLGQVEALLHGWADPHFKIVRVLVGCRGGKHRSVAMAAAIASALNDRDIPTLVDHLHVDRPVVGA